MSDVGKSDIKARNEDWEDELWSLVENGDGTNCPLYKSCQYRREHGDCLSRNSPDANLLHQFLDRDFIDFSSSYNKQLRLPMCPAFTRIFMLIRRLARSYGEKIGIKEIPVKTDNIHNGCFDQPVEVRLVPLKSAHGAVWRLKDSWVIHLNERDSSARRRFTFYHELFHIIAHCNANPVFKRSPFQKDGAFNELLADHFAGVIIMPEAMLYKKWREIKDVRRMAATFDVPEPLMYCGLKHLKII